MVTFGTTADADTGGSGPLLTATDTVNEDSFDVVLTVLATYAIFSAYGSADAAVTEGGKALDKLAATLAPASLHHLHQRGRFRSGIST